MKKAIPLLIALILIGAPAFAALKVNDPAPAFSLPDMAGKKFFFPGAQPNGTGGVVISFFASWCIPCRTELPMLNSLAQELSGKGIKVVLVGVREDAGTIKQLLTELKVDKPVSVTDRDGTVTEQYRVLFLPTTFFVNRDGRVKDIIFGPIRDEAQLRKSVSTITTP